ncbi:MAG TPA: FAD-dependent oxidoreductase [Candidatus Dormibacteraeota bacterium]|nr:FAD-dependent oxidoreductase [Candidatus Dormibacteraeota bacterium]
MKPPAPLAESYREAPYWWDQAAPARPSPAPLPTEADVVIVGGGYTGVMAAARLAWRGRAVALLESHELGWGASSRNGGMVHPGFKVGAATLLQRHGEDGAAIYQSSLEAFDLVERTIAEHRIDCDYTRSGHLDLAYRPGHLKGLESEARVLAERFKLDVRMIDRSGLTAEVGSNRYHGGLLVAASGGLHPAKYHAGLTRLAIDRGAHLYGGVAATGIERGRKGRFVVKTERGSIACGAVLLATNGYSDRLMPQVRRRIIPIGSYMIATEPLPDELAAQTIPHRRMLFDTKNFLYYWRLSGDNRMLFGGRASFAATTTWNARDWLYDAMIRVHPQLKGLRVVRAWGGQVGFTFDRMPHIGRIKGITYAMGYCGTGVAMSTYFGQLAADWIAGGALPGHWQRSFPTVPLYQEHPWFLRPAGWYYGALDRF